MSISYEKDSIGTTRAEAKAWGMQKLPGDPSGEGTGNAREEGAADPGDFLVDSRGSTINRPSRTSYC